MNKFILDSPPSLPEAKGGSSSPLSPMLSTPLPDFLNNGVWGACLHCIALQCFYVVFPDNSFLLSVVPLFTGVSTRSFSRIIRVARGWAWPAVATCSLCIATYTMYYTLLWNQNRKYLRYSIPHENQPLPTIWHGLRINNSY
jgi:hypothetical protein